MSLGIEMKERDGDGLGDGTRTAISNGCRRGSRQSPRSMSCVNLSKSCMPSSGNELNGASGLPSIRAASKVSAFCDPPDVGAVDFLAFFWRRRAQGKKRLGFWLPATTLCCRAPEPSATPRSDSWINTGLVYVGVSPSHQPVR
jgi:hypothetical protein